MRPTRWPSIRDCIRRAIRRAVVRYQRWRGNVLLQDGTLSALLQLSPRPEAPELQEIAGILDEAGLYTLELGPLPTDDASLAALKDLASVPRQALLSMSTSLEELRLEPAAEACQAIPYYRRTLRLEIPAEAGPVAHDALDRALDAAAGFFGRLEVEVCRASEWDDKSLAQVAQVAVDRGVTAFHYGDRLGAFSPEKTRAAIRLLLSQVPIHERLLFGVRFANNCGLAVANSLVGVGEGAHVVHASVAGISAAGAAAPLEELLSVLRLNRDQYRRAADVDENRIAPLSLRVRPFAAPPQPPSSPPAE